MQFRPPTPIDLSDKEMQALQQYADAHCIPVAQAATQLAQQSLVANFERRNKKPGSVVQFRRMTK